MRRCLAVATLKLAAEAFMLVLLLIPIAMGQEIFGDDDPFKPFALCYDEDLVGLKRGPLGDLKSGQTTSVMQVLEPPYLAGEYASTPVDYVVLVSDKYWFQNKHSTATRGGRRTQ